MKPSRIIAVVLAVLVALSVLVACNVEDDGTYCPPSTHTVHHYHHATPRTTPKYTAPAAPRVPSMSKGFRR
ncbi:hypothetical protein OG436_29465 [Streptomyces caniferus]|uniref:hypothetical protein n=1 Tax=Streptomyces caniferus TaxID=285557 RepID=UPI002E29ADF3|nr:hypothetical protein [Streptomyces caniferus]